MNTETKHTPGLLAVDYSKHYDRHQLRSKTQGSFGHFQGWSADGITTEGEDNANAARLVACWNACLDMTDPEKEIARLKADKAELVEGLRRIAKSEPRPKRNGDFDRSDIESLQRTARALLSKHSKVTT